MVHKMSIALFVLTFVISHGFTGLNRDIRVYDGVIREIQLYFKNSNVVFLYVMDDPGKKSLSNNLHQLSLDDYLSSMY